LADGGAMKLVVASPLPDLTCCSPVHSASRECETETTENDDFLAKKAASKKRRYSKPFRY
jgi:hypothetical protein